VKLGVEAGGAGDGDLVLRAGPKDLETYNRLIGNSSAPGARRSPETLRGRARGYKDDWEVLGYLHFHMAEVHALMGERTRRSADSSRRHLFPARVQGRPQRLQGDRRIDRVAAGAARASHPELLPSRIFRPATISSAHVDNSSEPERAGAPGLSTRLLVGTPLKGPGFC